MVSVIIPAFNSEKTIEKCIGSLQNQIYNDLEIIIVDDGSSDSTGQIVQNIQMNDNRIHYYEFDNHGVSWARNEGLTKANGDFIIFMDSDDEADPAFVSTMLTHASGTDLVLCGIELIDQQTGQKTFLTERENTLTDAEFFSLLDKGDIRPFFGGPVNKLYRKDILTKNSIKFNNGQSFAEDYCFNLEYLKYVSSVHVVEKCLYKCKVNNPSSLSYTVNTSRNEDVFFSEIIVTLKKYNDLVETKRYSSNYIICFELFKRYLAKISRFSDRSIYFNIQDTFSKVAKNRDVFRFETITGLKFPTSLIPRMMDNKQGLSILFTALKIRNNLKR